MLDWQPTPTAINPAPQTTACTSDFNVFLDMFALAMRGQSSGRSWHGRQTDMIGTTMIDRHNRILRHNPSGLTNFREITAI